MATENWPVNRCTTEHYDKLDPWDRAFLRWLEVKHIYDGVRPTPVIIESPYRGNIEENTMYLFQCVRDSIGRGEAPFASHHMYTIALDNGLLRERALGIKCGFAWLEMAHLQVFYTDLGWSPGMIEAWEAGEKLNKPWAVRGLQGPGQPPKHRERRPLQHVDP